MGANRQMARNAIFNVLQFAINFGISFFFTPYLIRTVGKEAYSFFPLVNNMIGYTSIITTAVGGMAGRFITMRIYQNDKEGASYYFNSVLVANWILSIFFTVLSVVCVVYLQYILTIPDNLLREVKILFMFACATMVVGLATGILGTGTFVKNRIDVRASRSVVTNLVRVALILLLFYLFKPSIVYMSVSALGAGLLGVYYNVKFKKQFLPEIPISPIKYFRKSYLTELIASSIWNSVNQLSFLLLAQLDLLITNIFIGVAETGDYSVAKMMPNIIQSFMVVLVSVFVPHFTILYAKGEMNSLIKEIKKSVKIMGIVSTLPIGFLIIYGPDFFNLWINGHTSDLLNVLSVLTLVPLAVSSCINTLFHVYTVTNKLKVPSLVLLLNGIINVSLILLLVNYTNLGVIAIPIVSMTTLTLKNVTFTPMYAAYCLKQKLFVFHKDIVMGCSSCVVVVLICLLVKRIIIPNTWFAFILSAIIVSVLSLFVSSKLFLSHNERMSVVNMVKSKFIHK